MSHIVPALHNPDNFSSYTFPIFWISLCVTSLQRTCFEFIKSLIAVEFSHLANIPWQGHLLLAPWQEIHGTLSSPQKHHSSPPKQPFKIIPSPPETSLNKSASLNSWVSFHKQDTTPESNSGYCHCPMGSALITTALCSIPWAPSSQRQGLIFRPSIFWSRHKISTRSQDPSQRASISHGRARKEGKGSWPQKVVSGLLQLPHLSERIAQSLKRTQTPFR